MAKPKLRAWIYKCSVDLDGSGHGYSWVDPVLGYLMNQRGRDNDFGGEEWIRSPLSWQHLAQARRGDLVFCHQTDLHGFVGITVAASAGYPDPDGIRHDTCSTIDLGPARVRFDNIVTLDAIHREVGRPHAFTTGRSQSTFHDVEEQFVGPLLTLCARMNRQQREAIERLTRTSVKLGMEEAELEGRYEEDEAPLDPIRREIRIEAYERRAAWAKKARKVFGFRCMAPGCDFELVKENGELYIEVHHLKAMCEGGSPNELRNMSVLCPNHHRVIHYAEHDARQELGGAILREQAKRLKKAQVGV